MWKVMATLSFWHVHSKKKRILASFQNHKTPTVNTAPSQSRRDFDSSSLCARRVCRANTWVPRWLPSTTCEAGAFQSKTSWHHFVLGCVRFVTKILVKIPFVRTVIVRGCHKVLNEDSIQVFLLSWSLEKSWSTWIVSTMHPKASQCDLLKRPSLLVASVGSVDGGLHRRHNPWPVARNLWPSPFGCLGFGVHQVCWQPIISI